MTRTVISVAIFVAAMVAAIAVILMIVAEWNRAEAGSALASWYGPGFHGATTASGETYNAYAYTAAHPSYPFDTELTVCDDACAHNVRVNDRGPYGGNRSLDVSYAVARDIGMVEEGVAVVEVYEE